MGFTVQPDQLLAAAKEVARAAGDLGGAEPAARQAEGHASEIHYQPAAGMAEAVAQKVPHLIAGHAYYVDSVNTSADPPTVTVVNPWGRESGSDGTVTLTWQQFQQMTAGASIGK
jgi:hypothetical protein